MALKEQLPRVADPRPGGSGGRRGRAPAAGPDRLRLGREHDRRLPARDPRRARRARRGTRPPDRPLRRRHPRRRPRRQPDRRRLPLLVPPGHDGAPLRRRVVGLPGRRAQRRREQRRRACPLPAGRRRQHQPARRDGIRARLPRHEEPSRARARRRGRQDRRRDPHEHQARRAPAARQRPQHPLHPMGARRAATPAPTSPRPRPPSPSTTSTSRRSTRPGRSLPSWQATLEERRAGDAQEWKVRVAEKYEDWARLLLEAAGRGEATCDLFLQAIRVDDVIIAGMNAELFFETGLEIRARSPFPDTFALGYTNGTIGYLPRAEDHPPGGWDVHATYAVPDLIFQVHPHPVALHPDSERRAVKASLALLRRLSETDEARLRLTSPASFSILQSIAETIPGRGPIAVSIECGSGTSRLSGRGHVVVEEQRRAQSLRRVDPNREGGARTWQTKRPTPRKGTGSAVAICSPRRARSVPARLPRGRSRAEPQQPRRRRSRRRRPAGAELSPSGSSPTQWQWRRTAWRRARRTGARSTRTTRWPSSTRD